MSVSINSYDQIPYRSNPFRQSHLDRLATIATLFGLTPPPIERSRVLELGCAAGGNLVPMAEQLPESQFLGIDASEKQIEDGRSFIRETGLKNVELKCADILQFPLEPESFDYILCHGVYSWVPDTVQKKILEICGRCLTPHGVAYISYNTYPGWRMRGMIRDIMQYRARSFESPQTKLSQARGLLEFLSNSVKGDENAYSLLLKSELAAISKADDYYLLHEQLEDINEPIYFHDFVERAAAVDLQYLGEADYGVMAIENFPEHVQSMLQSVAGDLIETEQYMDFLRNRAFRQTLLCRNDVFIDRKLRVPQMLKMRIASSTKPDGEVTLKEDSKTTFRRGASVLTTNNPMVKAAIMHLRRVWPRSVPFVELASIARSMVEQRPAAVSGDVLSPATQHLAETLLRCFATSQVDLHVCEPSFTVEVAPRPTASIIARLQARDSAVVTNRLHELVSLDDLQRHVLQLLDGQHDEEALVSELTQSVYSGKIVIYHQGQRLTDNQQVRQIVAGSIKELLASLARLGLLVEESSSSSKTTAHATLE